MQVDQLILLICGFDDDGQRVRLYFEEPRPLPSFSRKQGVRAGNYRDLTGDKAVLFRQWIASRKAWQCLKVAPPYTKQRGIAALRLAFDWQLGDGPLFEFFVGRKIQDEEHRERLREEVDLCIGGVIENPNAGNPHELSGLRLLAEVIATAPVGLELAASDEASSHRPQR